LAEEDEFEDYDTAMFNSQVLEEEKTLVISKPQVVEKPKITKKGKTLYSGVFLLIAPPGVITSTKTRELLPVDFDYRCSKTFHLDTLMSQDKPAERPLLYHVYTFEGDI
jgi:hypothetical protein